MANKDTLADKLPGVVYVMPDSDPSHGVLGMWGKACDAEISNGAITRQTEEIARNLVEHGDMGYISPPERELLLSMGGPLVAEALQGL